jgi:hypothetical protein
MKKILFALVLLLSLASQSEAAFRLYIVPVIGSGVGIHDARRPKYFATDANGLGTVGIITAGSTWSGVDYGLDNWMVVGANLSTSDDNLVVGEVDAFALPFDLAPTLNAQQVTNVQNKLESINIPAGWVTTSETWIHVVRITLGIFSLNQRINGTCHVDLFSGGINLNSTINTLPAALNTCLQNSVTSLGLTFNGIIGSTTIRNALKIIADQMQTTQYNFNGTLI